MSSTHERVAGAPRRAVLPPKGLLLCLLAQAPLVAWHWPLSPTVPEGVIGASMILAGVLVNLWADALFRRDRVGVCPFSPVPRLIEDGPFRFTRNPMYAGLVLIPVGTSIAAGVPTNLWAPLAYAAWLHVRFVIPEEEFLRAQVGEAYEAYAARIPRWMGVPAVGGRASGAGRRAASPVRTDR